MNPRKFQACSVQRRDETEPSLNYHNLLENAAKAEKNVLKSDVTVLQKEIMIILVQILKFRIP